MRHMKSHQKRLKARRHNKEADDDSMVFASWKKMLFSSSRTFQLHQKQPVNTVFCEMLMSIGIPVMNVEFTTLMVLKLNVSLGELL